MPPLHIMCTTIRCLLLKVAEEGLIIALRTFPDALWHYMEISDEMKWKVDSSSQFFLPDLEGVSEKFASYDERGYQEHIGRMCVCVCVCVCLCTRAFMCEWMGVGGPRNQQGKRPS